MDPKLSEQLQQTLAALLANVQDAAAWTKGQIPELVKEKIVYGRVFETAMMLTMLAVAIVSYRAAKRFYAQAFATMDDRHYDLWLERPGGVLNILSSVLCLCVSFGFLLSVQDAALAWFAPRLYIVEWLMAQVHK